MAQDLAQEISDLTQLLQCRLDDEMRIEYERRLIDAIIEHKTQIAANAHREAETLRGLCAARCRDWQHCSGCPVEAQIQDIVTAAQRSLNGMGRRGTGSDLT